MDDTFISGTDSVKLLLEMEEEDAVQITFTSLIKYKINKLMEVLGKFDFSYYLIFKDCNLGITLSKKLIGELSKSEIRIIWLNLDDNGINDDSVYAINHLIQKKEIKYLSIAVNDYSNTQISLSVASIKKMIDIIESSKLLYLNLFGNNGHDFNIESEINEIIRKREVIAAS